MELPTPEEIAAMLRRRPIGAVLVDICHDLGITPGNAGRELWRELRDAITEYGGSLAKYLAGMPDSFGALPDQTAESPQTGHSSLSPHGRIEPQVRSISAEVGTPQSFPPVPLVALATGPP